MIAVYFPANSEGETQTTKWNGGNEDDWKDMSSFLRVHPVKMWAFPASTAVWDGGRKLNLKSYSCAELAYWIELTGNKAQEVRLKSRTRIIAGGLSV